MRLPSPTGRFAILSKSIGIAVLAVVGMATAAQTISSATYGIQLPVPDGWTPRITDTSLTVSSNQQSGGKTVVVGVQFSQNLSPYPTEKDWREQTMSAFLRFLQSNSGRLLTPNTKGLFQGDTTEDANYLALDAKSGTLFAGQSRFLARDGKGYELFVMGDTAPVYDNFPTYEAILNSMHFGTSSVRMSSRSSVRFELRRHGPMRLSLHSDTPLGLLEVVDLRGRPVGAEIRFPTRFDADLLLAPQVSSPTILRIGAWSHLIIP